MIKFLGANTQEVLKALVEARPIPRSIRAANQKYASRGGNTYTADPFGLFNVDLLAPGFLPDFQDLMKAGSLPLEVNSVN